MTPDLKPLVVREERGAVWNVLRVETGRELMVEKHLNWRSITCLVPTYQKLQRFSGRAPEAVPRALLPGYALISMTAPEQKSLALTVPGAIDILAFSGKLAVVEQEEVERIQAMGTQVTAEPWQKIPVGATVRIVDGPLRGSIGTLVKHHNSWRFIVSILLLGRSISVHVDGWTVEGL